MKNIGLIVLFVVLLACVAACKPGSPTNLTAVGDDLTVTLNWTDNAGDESGFYVYRRPSGSGSYAKIGQTDVNVTHYVDALGSCDGRYDYKVTAYNGDGESGSTNVATATLAPCVPGSLVAIFVAPSSIKLTWLDFSSLEKGFNIERSLNQLVWAKIGEVGANVVQYTDSNLLCGTTYYYRVQAFNDFGSLGYSNIASASTLACTGWKGFAGAAAYDVGPNPMVVKAGKLNADGFVDLAVAYSDQGEVAILANQGDGTFNPPESYPMDFSWTSEMNLADFNGDGKLDIVALGRVEPVEAVSVLLNLGDGAYGAPTRIATADYLASFAAADFDGDNFVDLAIAEPLTQQLAIYFNNGDGTFAAPAFYAISDQTRMMASGDIDNDGDNDLVVAADSGVVTVLLNDGNGVFNPSATLAVPTAVTVGMELVDLDRDGHLDLAMVFSSTEYVTVFWNNGGGGFGAPTTHQIAIPPVGCYGLSLGDLNDDGYVDLIVTAEWWNVYIMNNRRNRTFDPGTLYTAGWMPVSAAAADLNGDGHLDLAIANENGMSINTMMNRGNGTFAIAPTYPVGSSPFGIAAGDIDKDNDLDLVVGNCESDSLTVLTNNGHGQFAASPSLAAGDCPMSVSLTDLDKDNDLDLVAVNANSNDLSVMLNNGMGVFGAAVNYPVGESQSSFFELADLNEDGFVDLAVTHTNSENVAVLLSNHDGTFGSLNNYPAGDGPSSIKAGDIDGDGHLDLVVANFTGNDVSILKGAGDGAFAAPVNIPVTALPTSVALADLNGDGHLDLIVNQSILTISVYFNKGDGAIAFEDPVDYIGPINSASLVVADLDKDGDLDIAGDLFICGQVAVLLNDGDGSFAESWVHTMVGPAPINLVAGDFDKDADLDLAVTNSNGASISILFNLMVP